MRIDACFQLGYITGTYGINGAVHALLDTDRPDHYKDLESVFVLKKGEQSLIPFFISDFKLNGDKAIVWFEETITKDMARELVGGSLYLPLEQLPTLEGDAFYYHELIEWTVTDKAHGLLGTISAVNLQSPQPLIVMEYQGHEVLIPFTDSIVVAIEKESKNVNVQLPDGLLEVYLDN